MVDGVPTNLLIKERDHTYQEYAIADMKQCQDERANILQSIVYAEYMASPDKSADDQEDVPRLNDESIRDYQKIKTRNRQESGADLHSSQFITGEDRQERNDADIETDDEASFTGGGTDQPPPVAGKQHKQGQDREAENTTGLCAIAPLECDGTVAQKTRASTAAREARSEILTR